MPADQFLIGISSFGSAETLLQHFTRKQRCLECTTHTGISQRQETNSTSACEFQQTHKIKNISFDSEASKSQNVAPSRQISSQEKRDARVRRAPPVPERRPPRYLLFLECSLVRGDILTFSGSFGKCARVGYFCFACCTVERITSCFTCLLLFYF